MTAPPRALVVGAALCLAFDAGAAEYRQLTLSDGRVLIAEVVETEAAGMRVRVPQGELHIPFDKLVDMVPTDEEGYRWQAPWPVMVQEGEARDRMVEAFRHVPQIEIIPPTPGQEQCTPGDAACLAQRGGQGWSVVVALSDTGRGVDARSYLSSGAPLAALVSLDIDDAAVMDDAAGTLLGLSSSSWQPAAVLDPPEPPPLAAGWDRQRVIRASFAPLPGLPSLSQGDGAGFGMAIAVVAPTTALWIGVVGKSAQTVPEHAVLGLAGFYTATVLANQAFGMRSLDRAVRIGLGGVPEGDGASVVVNHRPGSGRTSPTR